MKKVVFPILAVLLALGLSLPMATPVSAAPVDLDKDVDPVLPNTYHIGDTIDYVMTVCNPSAMWVMRVQSVWDQLPDGTPIDPLVPPALPYDLNPGECQDYALPWVVVPGAIQIDPLTGQHVVVNTFGASGIMLSEPLPDAFGGSVEKSSLIVIPEIDVTKTVAPEVSKEDDEVMYTICVENTGDGDLDLVSVVDTVLGDLTGDFNPVLPEGATECHDFFYTIQPGDPDPLENEVTATYQHVLPTSTAVVSDTDTAEVDLVHPCIDVEKTVEPGVSKDDDEVLYTICVHNCGDVELENVVVNDDLLGTLPFPGDLAVDETVCMDFPYVIQPEDDDDVLVNIVTVHSDPLGTLTNDIWDEASAEVDLVHPCIEITKTVEPGVSKVGDEVMYTICMSNCGDVELEIDVVDDLLGTLPFPGELAVDETVCMDFPYVIQPEDDDDVLVNIVTVHSDPLGTLTNDIWDEASAEVDLVHPCIEITKTADPTTASVGDTITYTICVTNCGDVTLENIVVVDDLLGDLSGSYADTLAPGGSECHDFTRDIQPTDPALLVNCVTVESDPLGPLTNPVSDRDCAEVEIVGEEGCTPGFWKNHPACWECFSPDDLVSDVFTIPAALSDLADDTLMDALNYKGGKGVEGAARNLLRQAVAALLNACDPDVGYPMSVGGVIDAVDDALATLDRGEILGLKDMFDMYNNLGCPIDAHCRPCNGECD